MTTTRRFLHGTAALLLLCAAGCQTVAKKEDVTAVQAEVGRTKQDLSTRIDEDRRTAGERLAGLDKAVAEERASRAEGDETLKTEIRAVLGRIGEVEFQMKETIEKVRTEQEGRNYEIRRDIEALKKAQNELLVSLSTMSKSLSEGSTTVQNDLLAVKSTQLQIADAVRKITARIEQDDTRVEGIRAELRGETDRQIRVLLSELTNQQSEIVALRADVAALSGKRPPAPVDDGTDVETRAETAKVHTVKRGETLSTIARKYGVTQKAIQQANNLAATAVRTGQKLRIPPK